MSLSITDDQPRRLSITELHDQRSDDKISIQRVVEETDPARLHEIALNSRNFLERAKAVQNPHCDAATRNAVIEKEENRVVRDAVPVEPDELSRGHSSAAASKKVAGRHGVDR